MLWINNSVLWIHNTLLTIAGKLLWIHNNSEENWLVATGGGRERQLGPFDSGTKVYVKAAALTGSTTEPQYSAVKARIVQ